MMDGTESNRQGARTHALRAQIALRQRILNGEYPGGTRLYEVSLAEELDISRTPVREALSRLAEEGLLVRTRAGGFVVRSFAVADVLDMIELRGVLEGTAARLAAERGVCSEKMAGIRCILAQLDSCFGANPEDADLERYSQLNDEFHYMLARLAGSKVLEEEIARVVRLPFAAPSAFLPYKTQIEALVSTLAPAHAQHHAMIDAIAARQGARAEALAREHTGAARANIQQIFVTDIGQAPPLAALGLVVG
ncbi:GntR family transcriptional regulator [Roseinatronobacter alkalisoli]|uniref:GntR family transcriptional regulator n=1 Tax=Roseinatronobacter alkalisoli TaxID=3028235 RepID=A0ABT5TAA5_9RHOB|nr:GntR family transcriptional regulator [Roseinatronobacter sp. HJB301]MDD7972041.1 GntR family transcriptional regulator [Roseinatronobacter sp. HJB301]